MFELLAQSTQGTPTQGPSMISMMLPLLFVGVLYYVLLVLPRRKQDKQRQAMLDDIKKGDRVQTIGGVLGTVVSADTSEIVIKVDESTNTKMRFIRSAVSKVIVDSQKAETK